MMPFLGFLVAGIVMIVTRLVTNTDFLNFHTPWAAYDVFAIILSSLGLIGLAVRLFLILKA